MDTDETVDEQTAGELKAYIDDRVASLQEQHEEQYLNALTAAGVDRESIKEKVGALTGHGMTRRAALGAIAASVFGAGVLFGSETAEAGTSQVGTYGEPGSPVDVILEDLKDTNGNIVASADAGALTGTELRYELVGIDKSYTTLTSSSTQTVSTNTTTKVTFDTSEDNLNGADTANNQFTVQDAGDYLITGFIRWSPDSNWSTGELAGVSIAVNGSRVTGHFQPKIGTGREEKIAPQRVESLSVGDTISSTVFQQSGNDQAIESNRALQVVKIG